MPGWNKGSWGYHGDDGKIFKQYGIGYPFGELYGAGDVIGCGADLERYEIFFTKNGHHIGKCAKQRLYLIIHSHFIS